MKANYTAYAYKDMGTWTDCEIREKGEVELPSDGHGIRYQLRKLFPGFEFNKTNCTKTFFKIHNADWTVGLQITVR